MSKVISYSIFNAPYREKWEKDFYLRGLYFNIRMNKLLYPEFITNIEVASDMITDYRHYFVALFEVFRITYDKFHYTSVGQGMLRRMAPIWYKNLYIKLSDGGIEVMNITHVLCRDADAITTYREAQCVQNWLNSNIAIHAISDNPAHGKMLMGGMVGFKTDAIRAKYNSFEDFTSGVDLSSHGCDQTLMNDKLRDIPVLFDKGGCSAYETIHDVELPGVPKELWESNLTCRHIGSAGCIDMELLRFFKRFNPNQEYDKFETNMAELYPKLFYWR